MRFFIEIGGRVFRMALLKGIGWQCHRCAFRSGGGGNSLCREVHKISSGFCGLMVESRVDGRAHYFEEVKL